jgi:hypothetical protein
MDLVLRSASELEREGSGDLLTNPHVGLPAGGEERVEQVHEHSSGIAKLLPADSHKDCREGHAHRHTNGSEHEQLPPSDPVDDEPRDQTASEEPHL